MFTNVTYFDIPYSDPCEPVNQLPTMSGGITGSFVSGSITYKYHTWSTTGAVLTGSGCATGGEGIFDVVNSGNICSVQLLIVGGGGGGGYQSGGGGGGGQVVYIPNFPIRKTRYCCKRSNAKAAGAQLSNNSGSNGQDSSFSIRVNNPDITIPYIWEIVAKGGGGGGTSAVNFFRGGSAGTGGGGAGNATTGSSSGSAIFNTSVYYNGFNGGDGTYKNIFPTPDPKYAAGGGGGAGAVGSNATAGQGGNGGAGYGPLYMTGSTGEYYGGGGGGAVDYNDGISSVSGSGGIGGGGKGGDYTSQSTEGIDFLGGGGGGGTRNGAPNAGSAGGRGTVIITYKYQLD